MLLSSKMPVPLPTGIPKKQEKIIVNPHDDILKYAKQQNRLRDRATRVAYMLGKKAGRRTRRMRRSRRRTLRKM
jgi:hypothetical protein